MKTVPVDSRSFRYGLGLFETVPVLGGQPLFAPWHWELILAGAKELGLPQLGKMPIFPKGGVVNDGTWRWFHTEEGFFTMFEPGGLAVPLGYEIEGSALRVSKMSWSARYKTLSYLVNLQARQLCGKDEAVLCNEDGHVSSCAMGNLFWLDGEGWKTPAVECGCRAGVVRRWVLEEGGLKVVSGAWGVESLHKASAAFVTNSRIGICPVRSMDGRKLDSPQELCALRAAYWACVERQLSGTS